MSKPIEESNSADSGAVRGDTRIRHVAACGSGETESMSTQELRSAYLCEDLVQKDRISLIYWEVDRAVVGVASPVSKALKLEAPDALRADYFCERREIGIVNLGSAGTVTVDGKAHKLKAYDFVYVSRGARDIVFNPGKGAEQPVFYLVSFPAHREHETTFIPHVPENGRKLGEDATCNQRVLHPMIAPGKVESCQLVMGATFIAKGSAWNTMPPHTHARRSEVYFYFGLEDDSVVFHFMGAPQETRHLVVRNQQAVLSPSWSIHAGAGTGSYGFVWAMGGENQEFSDMDPAPIDQLL